MTLCPHTGKSCECQPQDGLMCPHGPQPPFKPWASEPPQEALVAQALELAARMATSAAWAQARQASDASMASLREDAAALESFLHQHLGVQVEKTEDARDAARYRWLRENCFDTTLRGEGDSFDFPHLHFESDRLERDVDSLDSAIDAAMSKESSNG